MKAQGRIFSLDSHKGAVDLLLTAIVQGVDVSTPSLHADRVRALRDDVTASTMDRLRARFSPEQLEHLVGDVLADSYESANFDIEVEHRGGRGEHGADLLVSLTDPVGLIHKIAVQVKMFEKELAGVRGLDQLAEAREWYGTVNGLLVTTAETVSEDVNRRHRELTDEGMNIKIITRADLLQHMVRFLGEGESGIASDA